jgi:hypothetical protein
VARTSISPSKAVGELEAENKSDRRKSDSGGERLSIGFLEDAFNLLSASVPSRISG